MNRFKGSLFSLVLMLFFCSSASASLIPFAVTDDLSVAERLPYGPGSVDINGPARITTDFADVVSNTWYQEVFFDGGVTSIRGRVHTFRGLRVSTARSSHASSISSGV